MKKEDVVIELLEEEVTSSKQYPFEPATFRNIFYSVFGKEFDWFDLFFDKEEYKSFVLWHVADTWYIYSAQFEITICWYKGFGRINQCSNEFLTEEGLKTFFMALKQDYEEDNKKDEKKDEKKDGMLVYMIETRHKHFTEKVISASSERAQAELNTAEARGVDVIVTPYNVEDL